jgi:hypothetical protein
MAVEVTTGEPAFTLILPLWALTSGLFEVGRRLDVLRDVAVEHAAAPCLHAIGMASHRVEAIAQYGPIVVAGQVHG